MDAELLRRVEALRRPLELAAADGLPRVRKIVGLGVALRAACDGLIAQAPTDALAAWRAELTAWETVAEDRQAEMIARGMRILMRFPRAGKNVAAAVHAQVDRRLASAPAKPPEPVDPLAAPTHSLKGIGPSFADSLAARGIETVEDLLMFLPRRYDDVRDAAPLADVAGAEDGQRVTFAARVVTSRMVFARFKRWGEVKLVGLDGRGTALVRFFNTWSGVDKRFPPGSEVVLSGGVRMKGGQIELANPDVLRNVPPGGDAALAKDMPWILARYTDVPGVPPSKIRATCALAVTHMLAPGARRLDDGVPAPVEQAMGLSSLSDAIARLHTPPPDIARGELADMNRCASVWHRRLAFGELFALGVAVALRRRERRADAAVPCPRIEFDEVSRALPFAPTRAQRRTIDEIAGDLAAGQPMNRLLQGDVGSGKTCVAFAAAVQAARAGRQTAVMAPTELLAEQHAATWAPWAKLAGLRVELLTSSTPKPARASLLALLAAGKLDVLLGTHALIADGVGFHALGVVVIDEQHRFGVAQRAKLRDKGDGQGAPHLLVMTATPIPRTLALTAYGDLDISVLDELPPGRQPVATKLVRGAKGEASAYKLIGERVAAGERAYVVCPKVDDEGESDWKDVTTVHRELCGALPKARVGLVHGRLDAVARDRVMRAFKTGELDVLVATTVIEVGVDVPAATVMVIHDADRFGLAQLHQLRGRVGRGGGRAHCVLVAGKPGEDGERRLAAMVATHDGFRIAEEDLALRGPGELLGPRQAGVPRMRFGDLAQHTELLLDARRHADAVLGSDPDLVRPEHAGLRLAIVRRLAHKVYGAEGG